LQEYENQPMQISNTKYLLRRIFSYFIYERLGINIKDIFKFLQPFYLKVLIGRKDLNGVHCWLSEHDEAVAI
jgi:hypothetical protein